MSNHETPREIRHDPQFDVLALYREVERLTGSMLSAAHRADWDRLVELEAGCASCVKALQGCGVPEQLSAEAKQQKAELLRRILANDREIRQLTEPWMKNLAKYLEVSDTRCEVAKAYGEH